MNLQNAKVFTDIRLPNFFSEKVSVIYDTETVPEEIKYLEPALALVDELIETSPPSIPLLSINIYFLSRKSVEFIFNDENVLGCYNQFIFFPVMHWRKLNLESDVILFTMVEELSHAVWQIPDGSLIEKKVEDVFKTIKPDFNYTEFLKQVDQSI